MSDVNASNSQVVICNIGFIFDSVTTIPTDGVCAASSEARRKAGSIVENTEFAAFETRGDRSQYGARKRGGRSGIGIAEKPRCFPRRCEYLSMEATTTGE